MVVYFNGILIFCMSLTEHLEHLREVLLVLRRDQLFATLKKCEFGSPEVHFLGISFQQQGSLSTEERLRRSTLGLLRLHCQKLKFFMV